MTDTLCFTFYGIFVLSVIWLLICNYRTHVHRVKIITKIFTGSDWVQCADAFHDVDYPTHVRALVFFRDPRKLYPQIIRDKMGWK